MQAWVNLSLTKSSPTARPTFCLQLNVIPFKQSHARRYSEKFIGASLSRKLLLLKGSETSPHRFVKGLIIPLDPPPPKGSINDADFIPEMTAGWFSLLTFSWMNSLMALGYARPLQASDLWKLQEHRSSEVIANAILDSFEARCRKADEFNTRLANGEIKLPLRLRLMSRLRGDGEVRLKQWVEKDGRKQPSLTLAINDSIKWWFWSSGLLKVVADTAQGTSPLVVKVGFTPYTSIPYTVSSDPCSRLSVPYQICDRFQPRSSRWITCSRHWAGNCSGYSPSDFATFGLALSKPFLLSLKLVWGSYPRRPHHCYLFTLSTSHHQCSGKVVYRQINQSHLDRRLPDRLLLWILSHVLVGSYPIVHLSCPTDCQPWPECSGRLCRLHPPHPDTKRDYEVLISNATKFHGMDRQEGEVAPGTPWGHETHQVFCLGSSFPEAHSWIQAT
jgi:hypothetical protein